MALLSLEAWRQATCIPNRRVIAPEDRPSDRGDQREVDADRQRNRHQGGGGEGRDDRPGLPRSPSRSAIRAKRSPAPGPRTSCGRLQGPGAQGQHAVGETGEAGRGRGRPGRRRRRRRRPGRISSSTSGWAELSRPACGSSSSSSRGGARNSRARSVRLRMPCEHRSAGRPAAPARPTRARAASGFLLAAAGKARHQQAGFRSGRAVRPGPGRGRPVRCSGRTEGTSADPSADPENGARAPGRRQQRRDHPEQGRLAGAVRSLDAETLALVEMERDRRDDRHQIDGHVDIVAVRPGGSPGKCMGIATVRPRWSATRRSSRRSGPAVASPEKIRALVHGRDGCGPAQLLARGPRLSPAVRRVGPPDRRGHRAGTSPSSRTSRAPSSGSGPSAAGSIELEADEILRILPGRLLSTEPDLVYVDYPHLLEDVEVGEEIILADGLIRLVVIGRDSGPPPGPGPDRRDAQRRQGSGVSPHRSAGPDHHREGRGRPCLRARVGSRLDRGLIRQERRRSAGGCGNWRVTCR